MSGASERLARAAAAAAPRSVYFFALHTTERDSDVRATAYGRGARRRRGGESRTASIAQCAFVTDDPHSQTFEPSCTLPIGPSRRWAHPNLTKRSTLPRPAKRQQIGALVHPRPSGPCTLGPSGAPRMLIERACPSWQP